MGYLVLSHKEGEEIQLSIESGVDTDKLLRNLMRDGITIWVNIISDGQARIGLDAPREILVLRSELCEQ